MSTHKYAARICVIALALCLLLTAVLMNGKALGIPSSGPDIGYEDRLFDTSRVHTLDLVLEDWDGFLETCENEEYTACTVIIDGESYKNVALRAKGNTSLRNVSSLNSQRYSFKIEFDHFDAGNTYHGLDKLSLNNIIQDNTYLKDYLTYQMMGQFGVAAPLCSFVYITVNGQDWGLYLAVEAIEDSFLQRNYGADPGELYKPDSTSMGGGRGNGKEFDMENFDFEAAQEAMPDPSQAGVRPEPGEGGAGFAAGIKAGSGDVLLQDCGDDPDSYSNIFDNAKTDITAADQARLMESLQALSRGDVESALDVDAVLRYFVVHNFVVNGDSYTCSLIHNYYLYEEGGKLSMLPWDYNLAFGTFQGSDAASAVNDDIDRPLSVTGSGDRPMVDWILQDETYTALYHQYFAEFLDTVDIQGILDQAAGLIAPYVEQDPTKFCTYEDFETGVAALKAFCQLRTQSVQNQLSGMEETVDASQLNLSDMGSMGGGFAEEKQPGGDGLPEFSKEMTPPEGMTMPERMTSQEKEFSMAGGRGGKAQNMPMDTPMDTPMDASGQTGKGLLTLGLSAAVLLLGLFFALKFRRRR